MTIGSKFHKFMMKKSIIKRVELIWDNITKVYFEEIKWDEIIKIIIWMIDLNAAYLHGHNKSILDILSLNKYSEEVKRLNKSSEDIELDIVFLREFSETE
ncbi:6432_t:CDS:2, partial [Gigaspora rosea]